MKRAARHFASTRTWFLALALCVTTVVSAVLPAHALPGFPDMRAAHAGGLTGDTAWENPGDLARLAFTDAALTPAPPLPRATSRILGRADGLDGMQPTGLDAALSACPPVLPTLSLLPSLARADESAAPLPEFRGLIRFSLPPPLLNA